MARRGPLQRAAVGAVVAGGALSAAKLGWDRVSSREDPRRFRLREGESVSDGLVRIGVGQLDGAIEHLENGSEGAVHEARKNFKRLRAVVRLARDQLGDEIYRRENRELRDLGRRLSHARDSQVLLETLDSISSAQGPPGLRMALAAEHAAARRDGKADEVLPELREIRRRIEDWPLDRDEPSSLEPGFRRIYRRARRAYRRAQREPTVENLHELRKRTKDVWYCSQILRPAAPKRMKRLAKGAHKLSDLIGEDHDLAILAERVEQMPDARAHALLDAVERRREQLLTESLPLGKELFGTKPRKAARILEHAPV